jgi:hypothetical protein
MLHAPTGVQHAQLRVRLNAQEKKNQLSKIVKQEDLVDAYAS